MKLGYDGIYGDEYDASLLWFSVGFGLFVEVSVDWIWCHQLFQRKSKINENTSNKVLETWQHLTGDGKLWKRLFPNLLLTFIAMVLIGKCVCIDCVMREIE